jgi:thiamine pyrophosphate-dependent acetolactate synthase large subunit-like protein
MDVQADINWIKAELEHVKDPNLIEAFKNLLEYWKKSQASSDWWDEISEEERTQIEEGLAQADRGEVMAHEQVMAKYRKWL